MKQYYEVLYWDNPNHIPLYYASTIADSFPATLAQAKNSYLFNRCSILLNSFQISSTRIAWYRKVKRGNLIGYHV